MISILPLHRILGEERFIRLFTTHYTVERVFAFPPGLYEDYHQIVIYSRRRLEGRSDVTAAAAFERLLRQKPAPLPSTCEERDRLPLPEKPIGKRWFFRGRQIELDLLADEIAGGEWSGARRFAALLHPPERTQTGHPPMPLKKIHIGSLIAASVMNNAVLQANDQTQIIVARNPKREIRREIEADDEPESKPDSRQDLGASVIEEFTTEVCAFNPKAGDFQRFDPADPQALYQYIQAWRDPLVEHILTAFPPTYRFNFRETFPHWAVDYLDSYVATRTAIPGRKRRGLFEGQKHVVAAIVQKFLETDGRANRQRSFFMLGGQTGVGKSFIAAAVMGLLVRLWAVENNHPAARAGWPYCVFVTESTLLDQMAEEIARADPLLRPRVVNSIGEADAFFKEAESAPWPLVMVTSRMLMKDGCGMVPAVIEKKRRFRDQNGNLATETRYICPQCNAIQTEAAKGENEWSEVPVLEFSYFVNTYRACSACGAPLWQQNRQVGSKGYHAAFWECDQHWLADADRQRNAPDSIQRINKAVCETFRLEGQMADFPLQHSDRLYLFDDILVVRRRESVVATLNIHTGELMTDKPQFHEWERRLAVSPLPPETRLWRVPKPRGELLSPPPARLPVAEYLRRLAKHGRQMNTTSGTLLRKYQALVTVIDEAHGYKGSDTNAGYALANLVETGHKVLAMTGTPYSGYASNLFYLEYRTNPIFRRLWPYHGGANDFVRRYGLLEWIERRSRRKTSMGTEDDTAGYSALSGYRRRREHVRERPAASPELIALLLDHYLFVNFSDLGIPMAPRTEYPLLVTPEKEFEQAYTTFLREAITALREAREQNINLAGAFRQALLVYCAAPWRQAEIRDRDGKVWVWAPDLEIICPRCGQALFKEAACSCSGKPVAGIKQPHIFAKERALLDRLLESKAQGRPAIVYVTHTGTLDIVTGRWVGPESLCARCGLNVVDGRTWTVRKRQKQIEQAVIGRADAVFINPKRVALGMNLISFCDVHFYQVADIYALMVQAFARPWRPTQTKDVRGFYHAVRGTAEHLALQRHARKLYAALLVHGDPLNSALFDELPVADFDFMRQLVKMLDEAPLDDLKTMFAQYNQAVADAMCPSDYLGDFQIEMERRDFEPENIEASERELESALEMPADAPDPAVQLALL